MSFYYSCFPLFTGVDAAAEEFDYPCSYFFSFLSLLSLMPIPMPIAVFVIVVCIVAIADIAPELFVLNKSFSCF
jgi:hypothetical protein